MATTATTTSAEPLSLEDRCSIMLPRLHDACVALMEGKSTVRLRTADYREVEYQQGDLDSLLKLYKYWYGICGAGSGYPDLAAALTQSLTVRGPAAPVRGC